jgi:hypothetical protein
MDCQHMNFAVAANVGRIKARDEDELPSAFTVDLKIECSECHHPFEFVGLPMGLSMSEASVSVDGLEAHLPIVPQGVAMPGAMKMAGFKVTMR